MKLPEVPVHLFAKDTSVEYKQRLSDWQKSLVVGALGLTGTKIDLKMLDELTEGEAVR